MKKIILVLLTILVVGASAEAQIITDVIHIDPVCGLSTNGGTLEGNLLFSPDNTHNIGADGATRPAEGFFGTAVESPILRSDASDVADDGVIRLANDQKICWEASPAGTDRCFRVNEFEQFSFDTVGLIVGGEIQASQSNDIVATDDLKATDNVEGREFVYNASQNIDIADSGDANPASLTSTIDHNLVIVSCLDADGCNLTLSETNQNDMHIIIVNDSANIVNFSDTAGVTELAGAFAMGQYDSLTLVYAGDRFVELSRSNN